MFFSGDPYRTLGLPPGAPLEEVKRAYRRLAKAYHPDTAGPAALPRFLAIKAAYEMLAGAPRGRGAGSRSTPRSRWSTRPGAGAGAGGPGGRAEGGGTRGTRTADGDPGRSAGTGPSGGSGTGPTPTGATGSSRAGAAAGNPSRPGAAGPRGGREDPFAWARQGPPPRNAGRRTPGGDARATGSGQRATGSGQRPPGSRQRPTGTDARSRRTPTRRATLGSTSYDDALHEEDRVWHGAAWYGVTTGTYWRPNPREYADPRKHGPEYEERARRAASTGDLGGRPAAADVRPDGSGAETDIDGRRPTAATPEGDADATAAGDAPGPVPGAQPGSGDPANREDSPSATRGPGTRPTRSAPGFGSAAERSLHGRVGAFWTRDATPTGPPLSLDQFADRALTLLLGTPTRARITLAVVAWPLLALLLVGAAGELTGCGRYAASCPVDGDTWTAIARVGAGAVLALLVAAPRLALRAAVASLVALVVAAPAAALLAVFGGSRDPGGAAGALTLVVALAWSIGAIGAASGRLRLPPTLRARVPWWR